MRRPSPIASCCVLAWCAVCAWFAFARGGRVPLVSLADFGFHELGHLIMYVIPISALLTAAMGSITQCAVPFGLGAYFWFGRRDGIGLAACLAWAATNLQDASVYIADAPHERLELVGGEHDWAYILGPEQLDRLDQAAGFATTVRAGGAVVLIAAVAFAVWQATARPVPASPSAERVPIRVLD
ncbi:MAG: hypothetical protein ACT4OX_00885 [Actinomycetota bacterium]